MAVTKVVDLLTQVQTVLLDLTGDRFALTELQWWLNAAYREIIIIRPDANTVVGTLNCAAGVRQNIAVSFTDAVRLIEVVRNVASGSDGSTVSLADRESIDGQRRTWTKDPASISIDMYMYDPRAPLQFLVYPPALNTAQLEIIYVAVPAPHTLSLVQLQNPATAETVRIFDTYVNQIIDYILYRAYSKDAGDPTYAQRALAHNQAFINSLNSKTSSDQASVPNSK